ncbi:acyl-CoA N-acyltransferase [Emericellopsis atlantica]|uniref:N-alpha-acetyltransferase 40 n=1 Tax=Emericellopsis atlantica TaxID=2614577 RepID=A0A9P7ZPV6_9HYPO|nr:acyl-CoA N-acyltransferase [Emericellopsis atlantica]KAG9255985.1 acyl-CoA N-acyltransferase [Emericellopsis atlantica]
MSVLKRMRESRRAALARAVTEEQAIAEAIKKSDADFVKSYLSVSCQDWCSWKNSQTGSEYILDLVSSGDLREADFQTCFDLIDETSGKAYRESVAGWHPEVKKEEMRSPELRYILVKQKDDPTDQVLGYTSLMPTFEDGFPVIYCYEIHLREALRGTGLGRRMMELLSTIAHNIPTIKKVMLTCFLSNEAGMTFYRRIGFQVDESSPKERKLRTKIVKPDYAIMSRRTSS